MYSLIVDSSSGTAKPPLFFDGGHSTAVTATTELSIVVVQRYLTSLYDRIKIIKIIMFDEESTAHNTTGRRSYDDYYSYVFRRSAVYDIISSDHIIVYVSLLR
jgi:hypothetical protein